ncbi:hypothetical protein V2J09_018841 [Rumex salicifolius]
MILEDDDLKGLLSTWGLAPKPCDSCKSSPALLFCRPHSAFLCVACDAHIHAKLITSRHERVWLCEVCEQSPADVTCKADSASLCASCDRHIHSANPLARRHHRLPVIPFSESPSALLAAKPSPCQFDFFQPQSGDAATPTSEDWPVPSPQPGTDFLHSDICSFLNFESANNFADLNQPMPITESFGADSEVPTQTRSISTYLDSYASGNCFQIDFSQPKLNQLNYSAQCISQSVSSSETGVVPDGNSNSMSEVSNSTNRYGGEMDRKARVMRYREKKKNRKFQKTIRYASRKAYAESRPRIKGRFAKRIDGDGNMEQIGFIVDHGVVPFF